MELNSHVQIRGVPHYRAPVLTLGRICRITRKATGKPVLQREGLAQLQRAREQYLREEQVVSDLLDVAVQFLAALTDLDGHHACVAQVRDSVDAARNRLDDMENPDAIYSAVLVNVHVIVQRQCLMPGRPEHFGKLTSRSPGHRLASRQHANPRRPVPQPRQPRGFMLRKAERVNEELHRVRTEMQTRQGAGYRVSKLVGHHLSVAWVTRGCSQPAGDHLGNRHLIDDTVSRPRDVLLPRLTVMSRLEQ